VKTRYLQLAIATFALEACMPAIRQLTAFSSRFPDNNRAQIQTVYSRLPANPSRAPAAQGTPVIAAVRQDGNNRNVVLYDLNTGRATWTANVNATSAPTILGDVVVVGVGNDVVGLDARNGERRWSVTMRSEPYIGAARDGDTIVIVGSLGNTGGGARAGRVIAVDAHSGSEKWTHTIVGILGAPAASGGYAFIPWDRQSIAMLDLESGVERARLHATDDVISWVFANQLGVFYGSTGAYHFTPRSAAGTRAESGFVRNPLEGVPGDPPLYRDAFAPTTGARTARDKIRFAFRPRLAEGDRMAFDHDTIYLGYYRVIVAINATNGEVRWARAIGPDETFTATEGVTAAEAARRAQASYSQYDIVNMTVTPDALVVIGGNGVVRALDPNTGAIVGTQDLHGEVGAISADIANYHAPNTGAAPAPEGTPRDQLVSLIRDQDNRLVPIRAYLVRLLAARPEQEVTRDLLELYRQRSIPNALKQEIATALRARRNGAQFLVQALTGEQSHYNFLENRQAPPLDVIAPTLAAMGAREAVPVLLQHMLDHETPISQLPAVINAIADLGDASAIPQLQAFVQRYKSDSAFAGDRDVPLQTAVAGIFRLGDAQARQWLTNLSNDASAHAPLRGAITRLFEEERSGSERRTEEQQIAAAQEQLDGRLNELRAAVSNFPRQLTNEAFENEWNNHLDELRNCAQSVLVRLPNLNQIRITVTIRSEPADDLFQTTPPAQRLPARPTFQQRMQAIQNQMRWAENQMHRLEAQRSIVRTLAYSPQDSEMQRCMNAILQPVQFPGFGRGIATRTFQEALSTVRAHATPTNTPGFGTPEGSSVLVPWFLVSSPSYDRATNALVAPAAPSSAPPTGTGRTTGRTLGTGTATGQTPSGSSAPPTQNGTGTSRPWWEE
jgi:outer membrane protein assembly factor BamB